MFQTNVPKHFLVNAISTTCFLINKIPSSVLNWATPYHQLFSNNPLFPIDLKVFGCTSFVRDVRPQVSKLDPKSLKCIFVGYSRVQKGYRSYCPSFRHYFVSIDITFSETTLFSLSSTITSLREDDDLLVYHVSLPVPTPTPIPIKPLITQVYSWYQNPQVSSPTLATSTLDPISSDDLPIALCKGKHQCVHPISSFGSYNHLSSHSYSFIASLDSISIPNTVCEALSHSGWHSAMVEKMQALDDNSTWDLVVLPIGNKAIGCCWEFAVKFNPGSLVARLKARLVAKGYTQTYGVDYSNTFSPIAKMT